MQQLLMIILGYVIHDAIQPTLVGEVLDKLALPADLLMKTKGETDAQDPM